MTQDCEKYQIREVDTSSDSVLETLTELHRRTFRTGAPIPAFDIGHWWIVNHSGCPVAFAGLVASTALQKSGYFCRVGVVKGHLGRGLQRRLMSALERRARHNAWHWIISDTTDNVFSANNFIRMGYRLFRPPSPWGWPRTLYWQKEIKPICSREMRNPR